MFSLHRKTSQIPIGQADRCRSQQPENRVDVRNRCFQAERPAYTKPDGTPNYEAAFPSDFYDDMPVVVDKLMSVGTILSSSVVANKVIYVGSTDENLYALM